MHAQGGINFAVFTSSAYAVSLVLFTEQDLHNGAVTHEIELNPDVNRTGDIWHITLPKLRDDLLYGESSMPCNICISSAGGGHAGQDVGNKPAHCCINLVTWSMHGYKRAVCCGISFS